MALDGGTPGKPGYAPIPPDAAPDESPADSAPDVPRERHLLSPLAAGSRVLSWEVLAIHALAMGAVRVQLRGEGGVAFDVEVLARDASPIVARPPAETAKFALYVSNGGNGRKPTAEEQGLAAMALAQIVANNEAHVSAEGFLTHGTRIAENPVALLDHVDGSAPWGTPGLGSARARV